MIKKTPEVPLLPEPQQSMPVSGSPLAEKEKRTPRLWVWLGSVLVVGLLLVGIITFVVWNWLNGLQFSPGTSVAPVSVTTFTVGRTALYADVTLTVVNAQYAQSFPDDHVHPGPATLRLNLHATNKTSYPTTFSYYDVARLQVAAQSSLIAPTNLNLSAGLNPGASQNGWLDFPVAQNIQLSTLKLQLGNRALNETLVTVPFSGSFDAARFNSQSFPQSLTIEYSFNGATLVYHLNSVVISYSYKGSECHTGSQFYLLNFTVDNPNGRTISPGFGYDYIRLVYNGNNHPPVDNTLPYGFKAGAHGVAGRVVYSAPAGMRHLSLGFLYQLYPGQSNYDTDL